MTPATIDIPTPYATSATRSSALGNGHVPPLQSCRNGWAGAPLQPTLRDCKRSLTRWPSTEVLGYCHPVPAGTKASKPGTHHGIVYWSQRFDAGTYCAEIRH